MQPDDCDVRVLEKTQQELQNKAFFLYVACATLEKASFAQVCKVRWQQAVVQGDKEVFESRRGVDKGDRRLSGVRGNDSG